MLILFISNEFSLFSKIFGAKILQKLILHNKNNYIYPSHIRMTRINIKTYILIISMFMIDTRVFMMAKKHIYINIGIDMTDI